MPQSPMLRTFANEKARVTFDLLESAYETARRFVSEYDAYGIASEVSDLQNTDRVEDGSDVDGRKALLVRELKALNSVCAALETWFDTTQFNTIPVTDIVKSASVNGQARF